MYELTKALHIISLVAWFAGLFYLPRLFVYHVEGAKNEYTHKMLCTMEYRLYKYIMNPAMMSTWVFGILLIIQNPGVLSFGWLHFKLLFVITLTIFHVKLKAHIRNFSAHKNIKPERFFRFYNEVPTLILIIVVILAVTKLF